MTSEGCLRSRSALLMVGSWAAPKTPSWGRWASGRTAATGSADALMCQRVPDGKELANKLLARRGCCADARWPESSYWCCMYCPVCGEPFLSQ
eukprot:6027748-Alexandrium_andersonii.AAC.1